MLSEQIKKGRHVIKSAVLTGDHFTKGNHRGEHVIGNGFTETVIIDAIQAEDFQYLRTETGDYIYEE